jgi:hypothetical protein
MCALAHRADAPVFELSDLVYIWLGHILPLKLGLSPGKDPPATRPAVPSYRLDITHYVTLPT